MPGELCPFTAERTFATQLTLGFWNDVKKFIEPNLEDMTMSIYDHRVFHHVMVFHLPNYDKILKNMFYKEMVKV